MERATIRLGLRYTKIENEARLTVHELSDALKLKREELANTLVFNFS